MSRNVKVLGASEKNKRALQLALTIPGNAASYGSAKPEIKYKQEQKKQLLPRLRFHMYISSDEDENKYLSIDPGRINISMGHQERVYFEFKQNSEYGYDPISLSGLSEDLYSVILLFQYDPNNVNTDDINTHFAPTVYFVDDEHSYTNNIPQTRGIYSIPLGRLNVEYSDRLSGYAYSISSQYLYSDFDVNFENVEHPFSIFAYSSEYLTNGMIKNTYDISDFTFSVNDGVCYFNQSQINVDGISFQCNDYTYVYLTINEQDEFGYIQDTQQPLDYYNYETGDKNILIGQIFIDEDSGLTIIQYINDDVILGGDTFKVKAISGDVEPGYLSSKFEFQDVNDDDILTGYPDSFIGAKLLSTAVPALSGYNWRIEPFWAYKEIDEYDPQLTQAIITSGGVLKWDNKEIYKVLASSSDTQPGFLYDELYQNSKSIKVSTFSNYDNNILVKLDVKPTYFTSVDNSITITPDGEDSLDFSVKLNEGRCIQITKGQGSYTIGVDKSCVFSDFSITGTSPILVSGSRNSWSIAFDDSQFVKSITSQDSTISVSRSGSTVDLSVPNLGKVKIDAADPLGYLGSKFANTNDIINFQVQSNSIQAELGGDAIVSEGSIDVNITNGFATIDVDWSKVIIDQSLAPLITRTVSGTACVLSLNVPQGGPYVLMANNGAVSWTQVGQCPEDQPEEQAQEE